MVRFQALTWVADGPDVRVGLEVDGGRQLDECKVVVDLGKVDVGVNHDPANR